MADQTDMPEEIQEEYYNTQPKERAGVAWLLAFGTLIVTVVIAAGLFFAGRWVYRQVVDDPGSSDTTSVGTDNDADESAVNDTPETPAHEPDEDHANDEDGVGVVAGDATPEGSLPDTGPGSTVAIFAAVSILGYMIHRVHVATRQ